MTTYILRRILLAVLVIILVTLLVFLAMRLLPGDPISMLVTPSESKQYTQHQIDQLKHEYGMDKPLVVQYFNWVGGIFQGDLGISIVDKTAVTQGILKRLPVTLNIGLLAFLVGLVLGIPAGILCAIKRGTYIDTIITTLSNIGITIPIFWLGLILIYFFSLYLKWLPVMGYTSPFTDFTLNIKQMIMPVTCLALFPLASNARQTRSSMLEVMRQDYIRTAWSKGLKDRIIIIRHALKNGLIPVINLAGIGFSMIIGGSVIVEQVFNISGMGRLMLTAIVGYDYPYVQGIILITAIAVTFVNLVIDLACGWVDPRIRFS